MAAGQIATFCLLLPVTLSSVAIEIDDENRLSTRYTPSSIIGHKQFLDLILFKSFYDVLGNREMPRQFADRPDRIEGPKLEYRSTRPGQPPGVGQDRAQHTQKEPTWGTEG